MILPAAFILGFALGWFRAAKRDGDRLDKLQYGAAHGIALTIATLALVLALSSFGII